MLLKQRRLLVLGDDGGSRWHTKKLDKHIGGATKKVVVPRATHIDRYHKIEVVDPPVKDIAEFVKAQIA